MIEHRQFQADVISTQDGRIFLNIDLGFRVWKVMDFKEHPLDRDTFKSGDKVLVNVEMRKEGRERAYKATLIRHLQRKLFSSSATPPSWW